MTDNQHFASCESPRESAAGFRLHQTIPSPRILVVEDDIDLLELNTSALLRQGYEVDAAADGAAAWEALVARKYDLMITDNNMPKVTGVRLLKMLRAAGMEMPVIMATGALPEAEFAQHPWLQPTATLLKPYSSTELLKTVRKILRPAEVGTVASSRSLKNFSHRILVVDGDRDLRELYANVLAAPDYSVYLAEDGAAGWEALQTNHYQLLITEHELAKLNGIALVRKLRAAHMDLPVVMAAGKIPAYQQSRNNSLHLAATLEKPFTTNELLDTVKTALGHSDNSNMTPTRGARA